MNRLKFLLIAFLTLVAGSQIFAQAPYQLRPVQLTFIHPLGTNGNAAPECVNHFSFNVLYGRSAGVLGAEFGGLLNQSSGDVSGFQMAGLGNYSKRVTGAQYAGLFNISNDFQGAQFAGLFNINGGGAGQSTGLQMAGIINKSSYAIKGAQLAGIANIITDSVNGFQMAGIINSAENVKGVQASGVINKANTVSGVQIGLINIADEVTTGVQIGLVNISRNGYKKVEVEYNESFYLNVNYKMGKRPLYSIWSMAYRADADKKFWAVGYGMGTYHQIGILTSINLDAIHLFVNEDEWWTEKLNTIDKLKFTASCQLTPGFEIYAGGSVNLQLSKLKDAEGRLEGSSLDIPKPFYDEVHHNTRIMIYPGFHAGVRF